MADQNLAAAQKTRAAQKPDERREALRKTWTRLLGDSQPAKEFKVRAGSPATEQVGPLAVHRELLMTEPGIEIPLLTLSLAKFDGTKQGRVTILALASDGLQAALARRRSDIATGLIAGCVIALVDVRDLGAAGSDRDHGQQSGPTSHSATQWMLGQTMLGGQLRDLRTAWQHLRRRPDVAATQLIVIGGSGQDSLAADAEFKFPRRVDRPAECQPEAASLALLFGMYEPQTMMTAARRGVVSYRSILETPFVQVPHAAIVPGALQTADWPDIVAVLAPQEVSLDALVDGRGRAVKLAAAEKVYDSAARANTGAGRPASLQIGESESLVPGRQP